jgi:ribosomal-protein-alanine N-acetyltransferase
MNVRYVLDRMHVRDVAAVVEIERASFSTPWPAGAYVREIEQNALARYVVVREVPEVNDTRAARPTGIPRLWVPDFLRAGPRDDRSVVAYAGMWLMVDEAHVTSVAVRPARRGRGLGYLLMWSMFSLGEVAGARWLTLEVRPSNSVARAMYAELGFRQAGTRPRYYTDNGEDAIIMWSEEIGSQAHAERRRTLEATLSKRFPWEASW